MPEFIKPYGKQFRVPGVPLISSSDHVTYFTGTVWGSLTNKAIEGWYVDDFSQAPQSLSLTGVAPTEITGKGLWHFLLTAAMMSHKCIVIKLSADEIDEQTIIIFTRPEVEIKLATHLNGTTLELCVHLEINGQLVTSPSTCAANIRDKSGTLKKAVSTSDFGSADAQGTFQYDYASAAVAAGNQYYADIAVKEDANGETWTQKKYFKIP